MIPKAPKDWINPQTYRVIRKSKMNKQDRHKKHKDNKLFVGLKQKELYQFITKTNIQEK